MKRIALILFFAIALGEILSGFIVSEILHLSCKPLIMVTLGLYYFLNCRKHLSLMVWCAILFSLAGDTLLMFEIESNVFFMLGLAAFLIAHLFYIVAFRQHEIEAEVNALQGIQKMRLAFPVVLAGTGLIVILYPALGKLKLPVVIYALVLVVMVLNALFRYGRTNNESFWMVFGGSLLFMISDSVLAINKFLLPVTQAGFLIMATYIAAQFLIIQGLSNHTRTDKQ